MPHSTPGENGENVEDADFTAVLNQLLAPSDEQAFEFMNRELETGEKAEDAVDYEDFDDDELPEEEEAGGGGGIREGLTTDLAGKKTEPTAEQPKDGKEGGWDEVDDLFGERPGQGAGGDELDDLFGDVPSSPAAPAADTKDEMAGLFEEEEETEREGGEAGKEVAESELDAEMEEDREAQSRVAEDEVPEDMDPETFREWQLQQALFASAGYGPDNPPAPPENFEELLKSLWPKFDRNSMPRFLELLPPKKAYYAGKTPLKPPKRVVPTKVNLELARDQERDFRSAGQGLKRSFGPEQPGYIVIEPPRKQDEDDIGDMVQLEEDADEVLPGGVTMQDLRFICADWDIKSMVSEDEEMADATPATAQRQPQPDFGEEDAWLFETTRPTKKRKTGKDPADFLSLSHIDIPLVDDPEEFTARLAKKIRIDMNDPHLLLDVRQPETVDKMTFTRPQDRGEMVDSLSKRLIRRYNFSNDEAYDMLKENHQNKVRSMLGNVTLEHSLPAVRLQWPYYKTKLAVQEARSFHRPALTFVSRVPITFSKPGHLKKKHYKGRDVKTLFNSTKSLSLGDNSHALLVEYSEEYPMMMSNFGMGSRMLNYYRKKNADDPARPKAEIGETVVLLPQDKSPFSIFGHIDPGETTMALTTSMFRAPVFRQQPKQTDFLVVRNSTGVHGENYYLRNIDYLYVAGQQFPSVDVPGAQSRKVSTAAKNRLKMICYRKMRKNPSHRVSVADIAPHFPESNDMQNRQKMKEFLQFSKDHKEWEMRPGEPIPDEDVLRDYVKPEDVCLLEAMQVGQQQLHDAGYDKDEDNSEENEGKESVSLEHQLAPWNATRNFLLATQGKAMLALHGEGDPTGRGEGFSFVKTSMKGGFKPIGESVEDKIDAQKNKDLGGHSYNVARQQKAYEDAIRRIWEAQKRSLSSTIEHSDEDIDMDRDDEDVFTRPTPRSDRPTPAFGRHDDESISQFSRGSTASQAGKIMRITRQIRNARGEIEEVQEIVRDPRVIKQYQKQRYQAELSQISTDNIQPTGDPEADARRVKFLQKELNRLQRNKDRRHAREKQKGLLGEGGEMSPNNASSPAATPGATGKAAGTGTQRKCANCGQVGHIKTNKKLCPLLNGTMRPEDAGNAPAFIMGAPPAV
ncbi:hypothetical protein VTO42DRAFT_7075 [Malbranchea cinnamomea]